jgi:ADP-heptose:LPS heptosyltransferase
MTETHYVYAKQKLTQLAEAIRRCDLFIGNDTAPMHLPRLSAPRLLPFLVLLIP